MNINPLMHHPDYKISRSGGQNQTFPFLAILSAAGAKPPSNCQPAAMISGTYRDDHVFAYQIQRNEGVAIQTDQTINWAATGEHQLTQSERAALKETYDITNLTPQDFYNLMSDLTNLNAISAEQATYKHMYKSEIPDFRDAMLVFRGELSDMGDFRDQPITNYMKILQDGKKYFAKGIEYVNNNYFIETNYYLFKANPPDLLQQFKDRFQECSEANLKMISIFNQLLRGGSSVAENAQPEKSEGNIEVMQQLPEGFVPIIERTEQPTESVLPMYRYKQILAEGWDLLRKNKALRI